MENNSFIDIVNSIGIDKLLILAIVVISLGFFISRFFIKTFTKKYYEEEIKEEFKNFRVEIVEQLRDIKNQRDFKNTKIVVLNDENNGEDSEQKNFIRTILEFSSFKNVKYEIEHQINESNINEYQIVILYLNCKNQNSETVFDSYANILEKIEKKQSSLIIYCEGRLDRDKLNMLNLPNNYVIANTQFTLIEYLHSAYLIKKIVEN